jgi:hypothetical protein
MPGNPFSVLPGSFFLSNFGTNDGFGTLVFLCIKINHNFIKFSLNLNI